MIVVMKSLLGLLALAAAPSAAIEDVIPNFLSEDELAYFKGIPIAPGDIEVAVLKKSIAERLHNVRGGALGEATQQDLRRSIAIKMVSKTTEAHEDVSYFPNGKVTPLTEEDEVGFIFLDTNPDAVFHHGDKAVPASAGSLVTFKGKVPHNTVITNGSVRLAGPFHIDTLSFAILGIQQRCCDTDEDCLISSSDECEYECVCPEDESDDIDVCGGKGGIDGKGTGRNRKLSNSRLSKRLLDGARKLSSSRANTARTQNHNSRAARKLEELHNAVVEEELKTKPSIRGLDSKSSKSSKSCGFEDGYCRVKSSKSSKSGSSCQVSNGKGSF